jgi:iron complex transport system permease protein
VRLPRLLLGSLVGASLSISGATFQGIFRNPLVSPSILGVSSGAAFGAALSILLLPTMMLTPVFAFIFGGAAVVLSYMTGKISRATPVITLVLGGTIISAIFSALLSLMKFIADPTTQLSTIVFWTMGSLASPRDYDLTFSGIPMLIGIAGMLLLRWRVNVLSMGDKEARMMGLDVNRNKLLLIVFATLATAGAVSVSGVIAWVGLVVPHIGRMLVGNDNKKLFPISISLGICFLIIVDTLCRTVTGSEIPLGIVTVLVGGPFFIYLLKKTKGGIW